MNYLKLISDPNISKEYSKLAKQTIIKDLYDNNVHGRARAVSLEFYEDEKVFETIGHFIPGCFYIFRHDGEVLRSLETEREFHDVVPIFLSLRFGVEEKTGEKFTFGINFNILKRQVRAAILQELNDMDSIFFDNIIKERLKGRHTFSTRIVKAFAADSGMKFCNYICDKYKIKKESIAFRKYYLENISKCRLIDYWQWKYLPFIDITEGVRGYNLKKLQQENLAK